MIRKLGGMLVLLALLAACATAVAWLWFDHALSPIAEDDASARTIEYRIEPGDSFWHVAADLERRGIIRNARVARWFARSGDLASQLKVGEYEISNARSTPEIFEALTTGRVRTHPVVIPEGLRATEIADRLAEAGLADRDRFLEVVFDPDAAARYGVEGPTLEGYLFPDTYRFARGLPEGRIAKAMVDEFLEVYREIVPDPSAFPLSMREHTTLASIVEKETGVPEERPLIAAVFLNRLERGMRLETDPTVIYGIPDFDGNLKRIHLEDETNPYNTYRIAGLPPGPIASPGRDALGAVVDPADASYLFFVSRNDGTHVFAQSYREHEENVDEFQRRRRR